MIFWLSFDMADNIDITTDVFDLFNNNFDFSFWIINEGFWTNSDFNTTISFTNFIADSGENCFTFFVNCFNFFVSSKYVSSFEAFIVIIFDTIEV